MESPETIKGILLSYQRRWVNDTSRVKIWLASRQIGKSFALSVEAVADALESKCNNLILSASERQSNEVMMKIYQHLRVLKALGLEELTALERESRSEIMLRNRSRILSLPASPHTVRGFSGNVYLDEFAFHKDSREIWKAMYPTVTRGYNVRIASTPNGKQNMFYELYSAPDSGFSRHVTSIHDAVAEGLDIDVEALRKGVGDPETWAQEYECRFIDEATAFLTHEMISAVESGDATADLPPLEAGRKQERYLGVDVGRKHDLTVFWLLEKVGDVLWTRMVREERNVSFAAQRDLLYALMDGELTGAPIRRACLDSSGIGAQLAEEARTRYGSRVEPVLFTLPVKEDLATTARRAFEDRTVRVPVDRAIRADLHSVKRVVTKAGNTRFDAERTKDGHADRFWALALALSAGSTPADYISYERVVPRRGHEATPVRGRQMAGKGAW